MTDAPGGAIVEANLLIEAAGGATLDNAAANDVDTLAAIITNPGASLTFRDSDDLTVGTVNRLTVTNDADETAGTGTFSGIITNGRTVGNTGGDVLLISETSGITVNDPILTTANNQGRNSGSITLMALGTGGIALNSTATPTLDSRGTTTGGNGQGGNISLSTVNGSISITDGYLAATGGATAVDGGNITLDANGQNADVTINDNLATNDVVDATVRGNISITADDAVILGDNMNTIVLLSTTGGGTVTITANDSSADGDGNGLLTMNPGSSISAEQGNVTLKTKADTVDEATITAEKITTTTGKVLVDANGQNADVLLQNTIATTSGGVTVQADDSVTFQATGMISATGAGNVLVRANEDPSDGDGNDELLMMDGSVIDAGTGTITLRTDGTNGGNVTVGRLVTQNITNAAVTIQSQLAVLDGGDTGGADIEAVANAASRVNIIATAGVGTSANALETSARRFDVQNNGPADIHIANTTANLDVVIERMATLGGNIRFTNTSGTGLLTIINSGVTSGDPGTNVNGGNIAINTSGDLDLKALLSSRAGRGGTFTLTGGAIFDPGAAIQLGAGNIDLTTGSQDILINSPLTIDNGPARFFAPRDIIVGAKLLTRVDDGTMTNNFVDATATLVQNSSPIDSNLTLKADNDNDGVGGVLVRGIGQVVASGSLTISGSDLFADGLLTTALPSGIQNGVDIERDTGTQAQLLAAGDLTLQDTASIVGSDIVLGGMIGTQSATAVPSLNVLIDANENIYLADNTTVFGPASITFGDATGRDPVIDDGNSLTPSNLTINSAGTTTFFGRVGDDPGNASLLADRIDSLTTDAGGQTNVRGGFISTIGNQIYGDDVFLNADNPQAGSTTFTTTSGDANFNGNVRGLDLGPGNVGGVIQDDLVLNIAGTTTFAGQVGINSTIDPRRIGDGTGDAITVNSKGETFFNNEVFTQSGFLQDDAAGRITFREDVHLDFEAGGTDSFFNADVTLDSLTIFSNGNLTFGSSTPNADELFIFLGSRLDTSLQSKSITINSQVIDPMQTMLTSNEDLRLNLNQGDLTINGSVGVDSSNRFGNLIVETAHNFTSNQSIYSETLTQLTGSGLTTLNGTVNTSLAAGITLATTNVTYNANIITNGERVLTQADGDITYTFSSAITTAGGMVVSDAGGNIIMEEGGSGTATISTSGGPVVLRADKNLTVSKILSPGGFVSLTATQGGIIDAGDQVALGSTNDIQAAQLRLDAGAGIGTQGGNLTLETQVSNLEARNLNGGGISISNTGDLVIGGVGSQFVQTFRTNVDPAHPDPTPLPTPSPIDLPTLNGIFTQNGIVQIATSGKMTVTEDIVDQGATSTGNIFLMAMGGDFNVIQTSDAADTATPGVTNIEADNGAVIIITVANLNAANFTTISANAGNVDIQAGGSTTFNGHLQGSGGGSVVVNLAGNFVLNNGFTPQDILILGTGEVRIHAAGTVKFTNNPLVQTQTGSIHEPTPLVTNIMTPQIAINQQANLTFNVGLPGETNFTAIVDWGDGTTTVRSGLAGGQSYTISHIYSRNPDPNNPGAPIRVFFVVATDPNIHITASNAPSLGLPAPPLPVASPAPPMGTSPTFPTVANLANLGDLLESRPGEITLNELIAASAKNGGTFNGAIALRDLGFFTAVPSFGVPLPGLSGASLIPQQPLPPFFLPGAPAFLLPKNSTLSGGEHEDLDFSGTNAEEEGQDEVKVRLWVLSPAGQRLFPYDIDPKYLSNPTPLWAKLPDGRYQIVIEEPGSKVPIVVRDVELRNHQVIRRFERTRRSPQAEPAPPANPAQAEPMSQMVPDLAIPKSLESRLASEPPIQPVPAGESQPDRIWENWRCSRKALRVSGRKSQAPETEPDEVSSTAALAGGLALATLQSRSAKDAVSQMARLSRRVLSPAARLRRRLRK